MAKTSLQTQLPSGFPHRKNRLLRPCVTDDHTESGTSRRERSFSV